MDIKVVKKHMFKLLDTEFESFSDCGEVNATLLAERTADDLSIYEDEVDYVIPEEVFDCAVDVSESWLE